MSERGGYVYILANGLGGTLYVGATSDLVARVYEHRSGAVAGFTKKYAVTRLVYFESFDSLQTALVRERQIKKWNRNWKIGLIEESNPNWADLYPAIAAQ